ncbi:MAG: peroxiredoxin [Pseudomonadota bacterium]
MPLMLGSIAPDFEADTTEGPIQFYRWLKDRWCLFFSHPKDFTPVCTTELGALAHLKPEFDQRGVCVIGLSIDSVADHLRWSEDIAETQGLAPNFPLIADEQLNVAKLYGMLPADSDGVAADRTATDNATARSVYVINPNREIALSLTYPMTTGRNFHEILRVIDSLQLTARHQVATPADWRFGDDVIITPAVSDEEAQRRFSSGWKAPRPYLRLVEQPA